MTLAGCVPSLLVLMATATNLASSTPTTGTTTATVVITCAGVADDPSCSANGNAPCSNPFIGKFCFFGGLERAACAVQCRVPAQAFVCQML